MVVDLKESAGITDKMSRDEQEENRRLKALVAEMFKEHQRIYHTGGVLKTGPSATSRQMARWYSECMRWGIEV